MDYVIYCNNQLLATFVCECDRDMCLALLKRNSPNATITTDKRI